MVKPLQSVGLAYGIGVISILSVMFLPIFVNKFVRENSNTMLNFQEISLIQFSFIALILIFLTSIIVATIEG